MPGSVLPGEFDFGVAKAAFLTPASPAEPRLFLETRFFVRFIERIPHSFFTVKIFFDRRRSCFGVPAFARALRFARYCLFAWG